MNYFVKTKDGINFKFKNFSNAFSLFKIKSNYRKQLYHSTLRSLIKLTFNFCTISCEEIVEDRYVRKTWYRTKEISGVDLLVRNRQAKKEFPFSSKFRSHKRNVYSGKWLSILRNEMESPKHYKRVIENIT